MASSLWNELEVKPPPTLTSKMTRGEVSLADLRKISDTCWNALTVLKNQQPLCTEAATLSRLVYRMRKMFRGDKGFKSIEKVNQCLRHFLSLNLVPLYEIFFRTIPWDCSDSEIYGPTRQMLEHVLVRTQGLAALLCRIVHTCLEAACLFKSRISTGHNWQVSILCLGAVSRIWSVAKYILEACVKWYEVLLPFLNKFQLKGPSWLSEDYVFPSDLTKWLAVPWMCANESSPESLIDSSKKSSVHLLNNSDNEVLLSSHLNPKIMSIHDDVGVSLSRKSMQISLAPKQTTLEDGVETIRDARPNSKGGESRRKLKQKRKKEEKQSKSVNPTQGDAMLESESVEIVFDAQYNSPSSLSMDYEKGNAKTQKKKKAPNVKNLGKAISSIKSQIDVETLLKDEAKTRSLTGSLGEQQWQLLKKLVGKLNIKLKKTHDESKKQQLLEQIRKAFKIALS